MQPAWQIAKQWHEKHIPEQPFQDAVVHFLREGLVHSSPEIFLCAQEVHWDGKAVDVDKEPNAWFVYMAASSGHANPVREFMRVATRPQKWALWHRRNENQTRVFAWDALARKVSL